MSDTAFPPADRFQVHHDGQIQGPFPKAFIEAMVISRVYPASVVVERIGSLEVVSFSDLAPTNTFEGPIQTTEKSRKRKHPVTFTRVVYFFLATMIGLSILVMNVASEDSASSAPVSKQNRSGGYRSFGVAPTADLFYGDSSSEPAEKTMVARTERLNKTAVAVPKPKRVELPEEMVDYKDSLGRTFRIPDWEYARLGKLEGLLEIQRVALESEKKRMKSLSEALEIDRKKVDRTSQHAVDSFNKKVLEVNLMSETVGKQTDQYNWGVKNFNSQLEKVGTLIE